MEFLSRVLGTEPNYYERENIFKTLSTLFLCDLMCKSSIV